MAGGRRSGIGWATAIAAGLEAFLVLLWIASAARGGPGNPHFYWYAEFPMAFLPAPALVLITATVGAVGVGAWTERSCLLLWVLWVLLAVNLLLFVGYALLSGGGV